MEFGGEVHLERAGELGRGAEGEVDVLVQHLRDVRARDLHALSEVGLGDAKLLHAEKNLPQEGRADMVYGFHLTTSSRPLEYAAEYFTFGLCAELPWDRFIVSQSSGYIF